MKTVNIGTLHKPKLSFDEFEAIADAACRATFKVEGRVDATDATTYGPDQHEIIATRKFKAQLRRELRAAGFNIWAKGRKWA